MDMRYGTWNVTCQYRLIGADLEVLLGNFGTNVGRDDIFKPIIENESLYENGSDYGVREVTLWV
jgi:hypothetical protein